jgi:hypothetical protein
LQSPSSSRLLEVESSLSLFFENICAKWIGKGQVNWQDLRGHVMKAVGQENSSDPGRYVAWLDVDHATPPARCYVEDISRFGAKVRVFSQALPIEFVASLAIYA